MWVYRKSVRTDMMGGKAEVFEIGYFILAKDEEGAIVSHFVVVSDEKTLADARWEVNYLNGGNSKIDAEVSGAL